MSKIHSKKAFMEKLRFYTSFCFGDGESASILADYEEWFQSEVQHGLSEEEICAALKEPRKIVGKLLLESGHPVWPALFSHSSAIQIFLLTVLYLAAVLFLGRFCGRNGLNYVYFAMGLNLFYAFLGMLLLKKPGSYKAYSYKIHLPVGGLALLILLLEGFLLPKLTAPNAGEICALFARAGLLMVLGSMFYFAIKAVPQNRRWGFLVLLHLSGLLTILLFLLNQLQMLYQDPSEIAKLIWGSVGIYGEILLLGTVFSFIWAKE